MRLRLTSSATQMLVEIATFTAEKWGVLQAGEYIEALIEGCNLLVRLPNIGRRVPGDLIGLRRFEVRQHTILYRVQEEELQVLSILHKRRNFSSHLPSEPQ